MSRSSTSVRSLVIVGLIFLFPALSFAQRPPSQVIAPVYGPVRVTNKNLAKRDGFWEFNQHKTGFHRKSGGVAGSNDTHAWDANWYTASNKNADLNESVFAVASGDVVKYGGVTFGGSCNAVLVAHPNKQNPVWYSGYIHLGSIKVKLNERVTTETVLGKIGRACADNDHLHFAVYTGKNTKGGLVSFNVNLVERKSPPVSLTGSITWNFNVTGNSEGWAATNAAAHSVRNGIWFVDPSGSDPYVSSPQLNLSANLFKWVVVKMASNGRDSRGSIYFKTDWQDYYSESKKIDFTVKEWRSSGNAPFAVNGIYVGFHPSWRGKITGIRIDPTTRGRAFTNQDTVGFDYIKISSNP